MADLDPKTAAELAKAIDPDTGQPRCTATNRQGNRCEQPPVHGATVCRFHGGNAPQVRRKAALRLMELVDPAITTLAREMVNQHASAGERIRAAENVLDRAGYPRKVEVDAETAKAQLLFRLQQARAARDSDPEPDPDAGVVE